MKALRSCSLFQTSPGGHPGRFWLWNLFCVATSGAAAGLLSLLLAYGNYDRQIFFSYFTHPLICLLNIVPVMVLTALLYCLIGRAWIAFLAGAVPVMAASVGNYYKILLRDDPFMFSDVADITTALGVSNRYDLPVNRRLLFCLLCLAAVTLFLFFFVRGRAALRPRLLALAVLAVGIFPLSRVYLSDDIYNKKTQNYDYVVQWAASQVYLSRGFVYPFLHSIPAAFPEKPEGYSEAAAVDLLSSYTPEDIPEDRRVNVIGIQLEAFNDLERLGVSGISEDVYAAFHQLEEESYTGNLITNIFAGGTVRTEQAFLTGDYSLEDFRRDTGSYVWYFKEQGYYAEGSHPCYDYFYNRKNVNSYLGFDNYYFLQNRYANIGDGNISMDNVLLPDLLYLYQNRDTSKPYFNFSVTYQGHGPYPTDVLEDGDGYWQGEYGEESTYYILNNYLRSVQDTGECLREFVDGLRADGDPVVLVAFVDHNPWLGSGNSAYHDLGVNLDRSTEKGFYNYYSTRYLIWANDAAKQVLGNDFTGEGPDVSPCFLMNLLFEQCGWGKGGAYMQLAGELMERVPVVNTDGFFVEDGALSTELSEKARPLMDRLAIAQYYRKQHPEW